MHRWRLIVSTLVLGTSIAGGCRPAAQTVNATRGAPSAVPERPAGRPDDGDADGVANADDLCPAQAEDIDDCDDEDGCPEPDDDDDGVADVGDRCRFEPGTARLAGCPAPLPPNAIQFQDTDCCGMLQPVSFEKSEAAVSSDARSLLREMVAYLTRCPGALVLRLDGRSGRDERGPDLAERRAEAVREELVDQGFDPKRLRTGTRKDGTVDGKEARRVDFTVVRVLTCPAMLRRIGDASETTAP